MALGWARITLQKQIPAWNCYKSTCFFSDQAPKWSFGTKFIQEITLKLLFYCNVTAANNIFSSFSTFKGLTSYDGEWRNGNRRSGRKWFIFVSFNLNLFVLRVSLIYPQTWDTSIITPKEFKIYYRFHWEFLLVFLTHLQINRPSRNKIPKISNNR